MAIRSTWEQRGVFVRVSGTVTPDAIANFAASVARDPRFHELRYLIYDLTGSRPPRSTEIEDVSDAIAIRIGASVTNPRIVEAYVVNDPARLVRLAKVLARQLNPFPSRVFSTVEEAREWLATATPRP